MRTGGRQPEAEAGGMGFRSLMLTGSRRVEWLEEDLPEPGPQEVLVETHAGSISAGTELPLYRGNARGAASVLAPRMTGYESAGVVLACGTGPVAGGRAREGAVPDGDLLPRTGAR